MHPLARKELREHLWVLVAMWSLCALGLLSLLVMARREGSPLVALRNLLQVFGVLLALALANRFVVREFGGRTQLFLETLPMGRAQVITVKWLTGVACLLLPMVLGFLLVLGVADSTVELTPRFILLLAVRGLVFLLFVYSLAFLVGLTGRYRYVLWLALLAIAIAANVLGQLPFQQWPPMQLVSQSMPFERYVFPTQALWITGVATIALVASTYALALGFQGSWVVALAQRMSLREKAVTTAVFISILYGLVLFEDRKAKPPFALQNAVSSPEGLPAVMIARGEGVTEEQARRLAQTLALELQRLRDDLSLDKVPVVAVLPEGSIDGDLFLVAELSESDGVVLRGAVGSADFDEAGFRAFTQSRVLNWHSRGRAAREDRRWLLDGYSRWRIAREDTVQRDLLRLRAAVAVQVLEAQGLQLDASLGRWLATREQLGDCLGEALAWRAVETLASSLGPDGIGKLARTAFGGHRSSGVRSVLREDPVDELLRNAGIAGTAALGQELGRALRSDSTAMAGRMDAADLWPVRFEATAMRGSTFELRFDVESPDAGSHPFAVRYARLGPWQGELAREKLDRFDAAASGVVPASFTRSEHVFAAIEVHRPELQCNLRLGARRLEVQ